jgi:hypothetical protein
MVIEMDIDAAIGGEQFAQHRDSIHHPLDVLIDPTLPAVLKKLDLGTIAPNDLIGAIAIERRVNVDEVDSASKILELCAGHI